jgi:glycosyltransferase involved in cell wall biosynthesis
MPTEKAHGYQISQMCQAFDEAGAKTTLLYPYFKNPIGDMPLEEYYNLRRPINTIEIPSLHLDPITDYIPFQAPRRVAAIIAFHVHRYVFTYNLIRKLKSIIFDKEDYAIYVRDGDLARSLISRLPTPYCSRVVMEAHGLPRMGMRKRLLVKSLGSASMVISLTQNMKDQLKALGLDETQIKVDPDAVDIKNFNIQLSQAEARKQLKLPIEGSMASFVGRFHTTGNEKGIPDIIRASKHLLPKFDNLHFYFIGGPVDVPPTEYDHVASYKRLIDELQLPSDRFIFLDKQPVKEIPLWLKASNVLLMPHPKTEFYSLHVSPLKMFEYMASKRPIVASRLPAIEEILTDNQNALLGEPGCPEDIAKNIETALINTELSTRIASRAYTDVQEHTWEKRARRILNLILAKGCAT